MKQYRPDTTCIHAGYTPGNGEPRVLPIVQSTTYTYDSSKEMGDLFDLKADGFFYTRLGNPTLDAVEKKLAALEGGVGALVTSSGQAATMMAVLNICHAGGSLVSPAPYTAAHSTCSTKPCMKWASTAPSFRRTAPRTS